MASLLLFVVAVQGAWACLDDSHCSFSGTCLLDRGVCECRPGWTGANCSRLDPLPSKVKSGFRMVDKWIWGSQVIMAEGKYHMMASAYPKNLSFCGHWLTNAEIVHAVADTPEGPYKFEDTALPLQPASYAGWDRSVMNPKFQRAGDGTYLLYYTGNRVFDDEIPAPESCALPWRIQGTQRTGLAYASSPSGPWTRLPKPVLDVRPGEWDSRILNNVAVAALPNGTVFVVYKASNPPYPARQTQVCIGAARAEHWRGPYVRVNGGQPIIPCPPGTFSSEDPSLHWDPHSKTLHLLMKDFRGKTTGHGYSGLHAWSTNGETYTITTPALAYLPHNMWDDGLDRRMSRQERAQVLVDEKGYASHIFFATDTRLTNASGAAAGSGCGRSKLPVPDNCDFWNMVWPLRRTHVIVGCTTFEVSGSDTADCNGRYVRLDSVARDGAGVWNLDGSHEIYRDRGVWRVAHYRVQAFYIAPSSAQDFPPEGTWLGGDAVLSNVTVRCVDERAAAHANVLV